MRRISTTLSMLAVALVVAAACSSDDDAIPLGPRPTDDVSTTVGGVASAPSTSTVPDSSTTVGGVDSSTSSSAVRAADVAVIIDATQPGAAISPSIVGLSSTLTVDELTDLGITLNSWGGNPSTRYNYRIGHAWNHGSDYEFRNVNYAVDPIDAARVTLETNATAGTQTRLAVPTLGWVAKNSDPNVCSFPDGAGGCRPASEVGDCRGDGPVADPNLANTTSDAEGVAEWVRGLIADGFDLDIIAMDNEPELWGLTHYDVHPECPTYAEVLDKYLTYADALRPVAPDSLLAGPVMCCWFDYWGNAPGPADGSGEDFLPWFLRHVQEHDAATGQRSLDLVDVHYYPQSDVFNDRDDADTDARRLRSTRSLWDPTYTDESWIQRPIEFIPRIKEIIEASYPGTPLLISEWNFGGEASMNGALVIADVLGIFGREGVEAASYWRNPPIGSPGYFAFKMHGNYDDLGSRFVGDVLPAESSDIDQVGAYAALDVAGGLMRIMLINKDPDADLHVGVVVEGVATTATATSYSYGPASLDAIVPGTADLAQPVVLPASSITVLEVDLT